MKKVMIMMTALLTLALGGTAFAAEECDANECRDTKIEKLYASSNGNVYVRVSGDTDKLGCTLYGGQYITLKPSHLNFEQIFKMLLSARLTSTRVRLRPYNGTSDCNLAWMMLQD